jgi:hypothetical protein
MWFPGIELKSTGLVEAPLSLETSFQLPHTPFIVKQRYSIALAVLELTT